MSSKLPKYLSERLMGGRIQYQFRPPAEGGKRHCYNLGDHKKNAEKTVHYLMGIRATGGSIYDEFHRSDDGLVPAFRAYLWGPTGVQRKRCPFTKPDGSPLHPDGCTEEGFLFREDHTAKRLKWARNRSLFYATRVAFSVCKRHFASTRLDQLDKGWTRRFVEAAQRDNPSLRLGTINNYHKAIKAFLVRWADDRHIATVPDLGGVGKIKDERLRVPTKDEYHRLLAHAPPERRLPRSWVRRKLDPYNTRWTGASRTRIITYLWEQGCRIGEALGLTWDDVDFRAGTVHYADTKTVEPRTTQLSRAALAVLEEARVDRCDYCEPDGTPHLDVPYPRPFPHRYNSFGKWMRAATRELDIRDLHLHDFRRGFMSRKAMQGYSAKAIGAITGNKDLKVIMRYIQPTPEHIQDMLDGDGHIMATQSPTPPANPPLKLVKPESMQ